MKFTFTRILICLETYFSVQNQCLSKFICSLKSGYLLEPSSNALSYFSISACKLSLSLGSGISDISQSDLRLLFTSVSISSPFRSSNCPGFQWTGSSHTLSRPKSQTTQTTFNQVCSNSVGPKYHKGLPEILFSSMHS
jgi:hypothetical protein